jgi:hypothetical protein
MATSSFNKISMDSCGSFLSSMVGIWEWEALLRPPPPLSTTGFWTDIFRDDVNGFSSYSDILVLYLP